MSQVRSGSFAAKRLAKYCLNRLPLKYLRELIVDACVAGKPPTEAEIEAALQRHIAEQQAQTTCCGRCCGCTCGWA